MPKLAHAALYVTDLERAKTFYETYFGGVSNDGYHNPKTGLRTYFLTFEGDAALELMSRPGYDAEVPAERLGWTHVSFELGSQEAVDALAERLRADGYTIANGPRTTGDGFYEAVVLDPEGNEVEMVA